MTTSRITTAQLQSIVSRINTLTNSPQKPYADIEGRYVAQVGCYHLSQAYGGYALHRMGNEAGGIVDVLSHGHMPKRELAELMWAYIRGLEDKADV